MPKINGPVEIDLVGTDRYAVWSAPTQGDRNTCVAFAVTACLELLRAGTGHTGQRDFPKLSPQFLYWHMRRDGYSSSEVPPGWAEGATKLDQARDVLKNHGFCSLSSCPYFEQLPDGSIEGAEPSGEATEEAEKYHVTQFEYKDCPERKDRQGNAQLVFDQLAQGRPVAIAIPVFFLDQQASLTNWNNAVTVNSGEVLDPPKTASGADPSEEDERRAPGHAVCIVGFQPDPKEATGGWFIFPNSRGLNWAKQIDVFNQDPPNVPARGYGAISATHVEKFCWEILSPKL